MGTFLIRTALRPFSWLQVIFRHINSGHVTSGPLSARHGAFSGCVWRNGLQYGG